MKRSTDRIIMSHAGSLHRPDDLRQTMQARRDDEPIDDALAARIKSAVAEVVKLQAECGVDVVNDGEYTKRSWQTYARGRLGGIERRELKEGENAGNQSITAREETIFPDYFGSLPRGGQGGGFARDAVYCVGPLSYTGQAEIQRDIEYFKAAMNGVNVEEGVLTALAPGTIEHWLRNEYYKSTEEFLFAIADAMHEEYKAVTDAGFVLQLDDPDLPDGFQVHPELSPDEYIKFAELRVEALNHSIRDIPESQVRLHICWGSSHHPHTQDLPFSKIIDTMFKVKAECYSFEAANPMHEWEWIVFQNHIRGRGVAPERLPAPRRVDVLRTQRGGRPALRLPRLEVRHDRRLRRHAIGAGESNFKNKVRTRAYPTQERGGIVWAYMGARETPPELPQLEANMLPEGTYGIYLLQLENNWMQGWEGEMDTVHAAFLHSGATQVQDTQPGSFAYYQARQRDARFSVLDTEFGTSYGVYRPAEEDTYYWRIAHQLFPFYAMVPTGVLGLEIRFRAYVPMDDSHTMMWTITGASRDSSNRNIRA